MECNVKDGDNGSSGEEGMETGSKPPQQWYPDIILAADCVYFEPAFPLLLETLETLLGPGTVCFFCAKRRRKADGRFMKELRKRFDVKTVEYGDKARDEREGVGLVEVRRKVKRGSG